MFALFSDNTSSNLTAVVVFCKIVEKDLKLNKRVHNKNILKNQRNRTKDDASVDCLEKRLLAYESFIAV